MKIYGLPRSPCSLAMTDKENALYHFMMTADFVILTSQYDKQMLVILSLLQKGEKSTEFKIRLKALKSYFKFMDTSLCYAKFSMTRNFVILSVSEKSKNLRYTLKH